MSRITGDTVVEFLARPAARLTFGKQNQLTLNWQ
jgi:hypothetical protein